MKRRAAQLEAQGTAASAAKPPSSSTATPATTRPPVDINRYGDELEQRYIAARDAWTQAMRAAGSGRPADMASLAIAQEAYETVAAEREQWLASGRVAISVEPPPKNSQIEIAIGQELEWRRVLAGDTRRGLFARIRDRLGGRRD
jgi:hypothetical protein